MIVFIFPSQKHNTLDWSNFITVLGCFLAEQLLCCSYSTPKQQRWLFPSTELGTCLFWTAPWLSHRPSWLAFFPVCKDPSAAWHMCRATSHSSPAWRPMFFHSGKHPIWQGEDHPHPRQGCLLSNVASWEKIIEVTGPRCRLRLFDAVNWSHWWWELVTLSKELSLHMTMCGQERAGCTSGYPVTLGRIWAHVKMKP